MFRVNSQCYEARKGEIEQAQENMDLLEVLSVQYAYQNQTIDL